MFRCFCFCFCFCFEKKTFLFDKNEVNNFIIVLFREENEESELRRSYLMNQMIQERKESFIKNFFPQKKSNYFDMYLIIKGANESWYCLEEKNVHQ